MLAIAVDPGFATIAVGYVSGGTWLLVLAWRGSRALLGSATGRSDSFSSRPLAFALLGVVASLALSVLTEFDGLDAAWGVTGQIVVGSFALAGFLLALISPAS